ncbi:MAG TPA: hypothetical protein VFX19_11075 [Dehalococcoidia bacterium]|nr:hypothetical protein [Dehalococcoidia bacterium]
MKPYVETLFRRPRLVILPALLLPILTVVALLVLPQDHATTATLWVDVAIEQDYTNSSKVLTASQEEAKAFHDRLETLAFRKQVVIDAGLAPLVEARQWPEPSKLGSWFASLGLSPIAKKLGGSQPSTVDEAWQRATDYILKSITVEDKGENLVLVTYSGPDAANAQTLVQAATDNYLKEKAAAAQRKVDESNRVHDPIIAALATEVEQARQAWANFAASLPAQPNPSQQQQAADLEKAYRDSAERLDELQLNRDSSTLSALTQWTNKSPNLTLVDAPDKPAGGLGVIAALKFVVLAGALGGVIGCFMVILRTWFDHEVRIAEDVEARLGAPVVAVMPLLSETRMGTASGH